MHDYSKHLNGNHGAPPEPWPVVPMTLGFFGRIDVPEPGAAIVRGPFDSVQVLNFPLRIQVMERLDDQDCPVQVLAWWTGAGWRMGGDGMTGPTWEFWQIIPDLGAAQ